MSRIWFITWGIILTLACAVLNYVHAAEPERWAGTPVFYTVYTPKVVDCDFDKKSAQGGCYISGYPEQGFVGITHLGEAGGIAQPMRLYTEVTCDMGHCFTQFGEPAGHISGNNTQYWTIPVGYYLDDSAGTLQAWKHGNGPKATTYPIRDVQLISGDHKPDGNFTSEAQDNLSYKVYCNEGGDCSYMGKVINYAQLHQYVPKRLTMQCDVRFCYDRDMSIAGLNPRTN